MELREWIFISNLIYLLIYSKSGRPRKFIDISRYDQYTRNAWLYLIKLCLENHPHCSVTDETKPPNTGRVKVACSANFSGNWAPTVQCWSKSNLEYQRASYNHQTVGWNVEFEAAPSKCLFSFDHGDYRKPERQCLIDYCELANNTPNYTYEWSWDQNQNIRQLHRSNTGRGYDLYVHSWARLFNVFLEFLLK